MTGAFKSRVSFGISEGAPSKFRDLRSLFQSGDSESGSNFQKTSALKVRGKTVLQKHSVLLVTCSYWLGKGRRKWIRPVSRMIKIWRQNKKSEPLQLKGPLGKAITFFKNF